MEIELLKFFIALITIGIFTIGWYIFIKWYYMRRKIPDNLLTVPDGPSIRDRP